MIICGFPGVGKTTVAAKNRDVEDLESSAFSHIFVPNATDGNYFIKNDMFPGNYIDRVEYMLRGSYNYILLSSHESVRNELKKRGLPYVIVCPKRDLRQEYIRRYVARLSDVQLIEKINYGWDDFIDSIEMDGAPVIWLEAGETLADIIQ